MGASGWTYFTPYQPEASAALQELQRQVFASGQYKRPQTGPELLNQIQQYNPAEIHRKTAESYRRLPGAGDSAEIQTMIARCEQMAAAAEAIWPRTCRLVEAMKTGDTSQLAADELREFSLYPQLLKLSPSLSRKHRKPHRPAKSIEELREQAGEDGTHSILDILRISKKRNHATASPLSEKLLNQHFGTVEPSREQVETNDLTFAEALNWQAVFFAVFHAGEPAEWAFIGSSGD
ncbi:MAG: hypothetical protein JWN70_5327 [Planctomycetaceae bacterium]|nr:hypothetical protein [Planctomycetaceae bacterium]